MRGSGGDHIVGGIVLFNGIQIAPARAVTRVSYLLNDSSQRRRFLNFGFHGMFQQGQASPRR